MRNKQFIAGLLILGWIFSSCVSYIETRKMDLTTKNNSGQILNLKFAGDPGGNYPAQAEKLAKAGFLNNQSEEYGYYDVRFEVTTRDYTPLIVFAYYIPAFLLTLPLLGAPTAGEQFTLVAHFYIFDSNGNLVKHYSDTNAYKQWVGLYYNEGFATKKGTREFSKLFDVIFEEAQADSEEINAALREAGPISGAASFAEVQANIDRFFSENPYAQSRIASR